MSGERLERDVYPRFMKALTTRALRWAGPAFQIEPICGALPHALPVYPRNSTNKKGPLLHHLHGMNIDLYS